MPIVTARSFAGRLPSIVEPQVQRRCRWGCPRPGRASSGAQAAGLPFPYPLSAGVGSAVDLVHAAAQRAADGGDLTVVLVDVERLGV